MTHEREMIGTGTYCNVAAASKKNDGTNDFAPVRVAIGDIMDVLMLVRSGQSKAGLCFIM